MKRDFFHLVFCIILLLAVLCGCKRNDAFDTQYPYVKYQNSAWTFDADNREIKIPDGCSLNQGNSYEWIETESGYDLVMHFERSNNNAE